MCTCGVDSYRLISNFRKTKQIIALVLLSHIYFEDVYSKVLTFLFEKNKKPTIIITFMLLLLLQQLKSTQQYNNHVYHLLLLLDECKHCLGRA